MQKQNELSEILKTLQSIDVSLQLLAASKSEMRTAAFISKKNLMNRLGVPSVTIDKLIYQGVASKGKSGLVEGRHYCKIHPDDSNPNSFLYDPVKVLADAWSSFQGY